MPYGVLDAQRLSQASGVCLDRALDWWQKSMQTSKHKTYLVLAGYDIDGGQEITLRRAIVEQNLLEPELLSNIVELSARNEVALAQKIARAPDQDVSGGVTRGVVDLLQIVQIEVDEIGGSQIPPRNIEQARADLEEAAPVVHTGQFVGHCDAPQRVDELRERVQRDFPFRR